MITAAGASFTEGKEISKLSASRNKVWMGKRSQCVDIVSEVTVADMFQLL